MVHDQTEFAPEKGAWAAAVVLMTAAWLYFLVFVRSSLVELTRPFAIEEEWRLRLLFVLLGAGGVMGSALAPWRFRLLVFQRSVSWSCRSCGAAAVFALMATNWGMASVAAFLSGASFGWLSVSLAAGLRGSIGTRRLGLAIAAATALGFALAHVPMVFETSARVQTIIIAFVILAVSVLTPFLTPLEPSLSPRAEYTRAGAIRWVVVLFGLTLLAVAFPLEGHAQPGTRSGTWPAVFVPGLAALAAGWWLDQERRGSLLWVAVAALAVLLPVRALPESSLVAVLLSAAGAGLAGVALVYYPARSARADQAGVTFALPGAAACTLGVLAAQGPGRLPVWIVVTIGVVALLALAAHARAEWQR